MPQTEDYAQWSQNMRTITEQRATGIPGRTRIGNRTTNRIRVRTNKITTQNRHTKKIRTWIKKTTAHRNESMTKGHANCETAQRMITRYVIRNRERNGQTMHLAFTLKHNTNKRPESHFTSLNWKWRLLRSNMDGNTKHKHNDFQCQSKITTRPGKGQVTENRDCYSTKWQAHKMSWELHNKQNACAPTSNKHPRVRTDKITTQNRNMVQKALDRWRQTHRSEHKSPSKPPTKLQHTNRTGPKQEHKHATEHRWDRQYVCKQKRCLMPLKHTYNITNTNVCQCHNPKTTAQPVKGTAITGPQNAETIRE